jgi:hypothetical protein
MFLLTAKLKLVGQAFDSTIKPRTFVVCSRRARAAELFPQ